MFTLIWNNWLLVGLIPPLLYAIVALFDAYFVDRQIFHNAREATMISALLGALPLLAPASGLYDFSLPAPTVTIVAFLSGVAFAGHVYFYIAALFRRNDTVLAESIQNLSVLCVPFLAFLLIDEVLTPLHYLGIAVASLGVVFMYCYRKTASRITFSGCGSLLISMLLFSFTLVAAEWVYQHTSFWDGFMVFSGGMFATGVMLYLCGEKSRLPALIARRWRFFIAIEAITTVGVICSHRAVDISPSATYIAITECLGAYFILLLSVVVFWFSRISGKSVNVLAKICKQQLVDYPGKIIAGLFISSSIYLVYSY